MAIVSAHRIHHLARYFGVLALLTFSGYQFLPDLSYFFLPLLGPPLYLTALLRGRLGFLEAAIPNNYFVNTFLLFFPLTVVYFGLIGFQIKNIINERGRLGLVMLIVFLAFLGYIHFLAFRELSLYWEGSGRA